MRNDKTKNEKNDVEGIDASVLGQIMAAQNILFVLPNRKNIAEFFAKSLVAIPGVSSCRVCIGNSFSQEGIINSKACNQCENSERKEDESPTISKEFACKLKELPSSYVYALETIDYRFGFFIFTLKQTDLFELYKPFVNNLGNFVALSLENRLQRSDLQKARDVLESRVNERTSELKTVNAQLEEEIDVRKHTELALQQSEEQYRFLFETMAQGVVIQDTESKILETNNAASEILGLSKDQMLGKTAYDPRWKLIHEDGSPLYPEEMPSNIALKTGKPVIDILIGAYIPEKEEYHWILTSSTPKFKDGESKPYLTMTTFTNITERKKAEESIFESQQVFRTLVENSPDIIARYDRDCKRTYVNPVYIKEAKIPQDELLTTTPIQRSPLPTYSSIVLQNLLSKVLESGMADSADVLWPKDDNVDYWYNVYATPEFDREGKVVSVMTISRDITARKQAEQERQTHLYYFECMDKINRALQSSNDLEQMMSNVLDVVLSIFNCDRAFLAVPCDPSMPEFKISMERTAPLYPGAFAREEVVPMSPAVQNLFQELLDNPTPNEIFIGQGLDPNDVVWKTYEIKSQLAIALHPKIGKPWECGLHQCSYNRVWTLQEKQLFLEISRRLEDGLTSLIAYRDLQESEQRYRMVFENSPVSIWEEDFSEVKKLFDDLKKEGVTDIETFFVQHPEIVQQCVRLIKIVDVNQSALTLHEAATKQELMSNLDNTFTLESFDTFRQELIHLWNGDTEMSTDAIVKTLKGSLRNVTVYVAVCPGFEESLSKILVSLVDVTERNRMEDALFFVAQRGWHTNAENFFDALAQFLGKKLNMDYVLIDKLEEDPDMAETVALYAKGDITPNLQYALKGTPCENVMGKQLCVYPHGIQQLFPEDALLPGMGVESYVGIPLWASTDRPIGLIAVMGCKPLLDDAPVIQLLQLVAIRAAAELERMLAEKEIRKLNQELEQRVSERTAQLEITNKELEAFAYSVSHDLRAPLRGIDGFSQVLLEEYQNKIDTQGKDYLQRIRFATQRMAQLIDDMLNLSHISRSGINVRLVDLSKMVNEIINNLQNSQSGRQVEFIIKDGIDIQADNHLIKIVMENLLGNAWKFTSKHPTARIEFGVLEQEGLPVYFVRDNGAGFEKNYAQKLFGAFQRLHTTAEFPGTGIGLATVQRIIHRHGGKVWAEGEVEKGATFYFSIPNKIIT